MARGCSSSASSEAPTFDWLPAGPGKRHRPPACLDDPSLGQGTSDLAHLGPFASGTDGELSGGLELGLHSAQSTNDAFDRFGADRVEQLLPHSPREGPGPGQ
jgi:hypothetical protein